MSDTDAALEAEKLRQPLEAWLASALPDADGVSVGELSTPKGGYSAETWIVPTVVTRNGQSTNETFVLRRETPEPAVYPQQAPALTIEVEIQRRVMTSLIGASDLPLARLVGHDASGQALGSPFYVMEFIEGEIPGEDPIYTESGFFFDLAPADRATMIDNGMATLAEMHAVDWHEAGLEFLTPAGVTPGTERQIDVWHEYTYRELAGRSHPSVDEAYTWLRKHLPTDSRLGLSWGDARPGNIIWRDLAPVCLTDFEAACIGPPEIDLGWWLMFDRWSHETVDKPRLEGEPTRDEQAAAYLAAAGHDLNDLFYFEVFAATRYCGIVVRVMNRMVERGVLPADQTIWLDNPASVCLDQLLEQR